MSGAPAAGHGAIQRRFKERVVAGEHLAMIEDRYAIDALDEIFAVEGLTGAFIGRGDLSAALGVASTEDPAITALVDRIAAAAKRHGVPLIAHIGSTRDRMRLQNAGVTAFVVASDQGLMRQAALMVRRSFDDV